MFGLGVWELLLITILLIFFFGSKRLPQIGENLGKSIREFKAAFGKYDHKDEADGGKGEKNAGEKEPLRLIGHSVALSGGNERVGQKDPKDGKQH